MINQEELKKIYMLRFSGVGKWKNEREMWDDGILKAFGGDLCTIEFIDDTDRMIVRTYDRDNIWLEFSIEYKNGMRDGYLCGYYKNGVIKLKDTWSEGRAMEKIDYDESGKETKHRIVRKTK